MRLKLLLLYFFANGTPAAQAWQEGVRGTAFAEEDVRGTSFAGCLWGNVREDCLGRGCLWHGFCGGGCTRHNLGGVCDMTLEWYELGRGSYSPRNPAGGSREYRPQSAPEAHGSTDRSAVRRVETQSAITRRVGNIGCGSRKCPGVFPQRAPCFTMLSPWQMVYCFTMLCALSGGVLLCDALRLGRRCIALRCCRLVRGRVTS